MRLNRLRAADPLKPMMTAMGSAPEKCVNMPYNFSWLRKHLKPILGLGLQRAVGSESQHLASTDLLLTSFLVFVATALAVVIVVVFEAVRKAALESF